MKAVSGNRTGSPLARGTPQRDPPPATVGATNEAATGHRQTPAQGQFRRQVAWALGSITGNPPWQALANLSMPGQLRGLAASSHVLGSANRTCWLGHHNPAFRQRIEQLPDSGQVLLHRGLRRLDPKLLDVGRDVL
jgi:hypothetical protein